jgi:surfactin family lipopeptide synthetase C
MEHINGIEDIYKLSPMQQGMLFHTLYAPDSEVYREQTSCSLKGNLNISAFQQAWGQVVQRHPILRTAFYWEELSEPLQVVQTTTDGNGSMTTVKCSATKRGTTL